MQLAAIGTLIKLLPCIQVPNDTADGWPPENSKFHAQHMPTYRENNQVEVQMLTVTSNTRIVLIYM